MSKKFLLVLFIGLVIRIYFIGNTGFLADISFWKSWSLAAADHGIVWTSLNTNINYPPGFIYVLWIMGKFYALLANPHDFYNYWSQNNFAYLFVAKSVAIISDVAIACLIYWFFSQKETLNKLGGFVDSSKIRAVGLDFVAKLRKGKRELERSEIPEGFPSNLAYKNYSRTHFAKITNTINLPLLLASSFFLNPIVILDSAIWGQVESFGILFTLIAILLLFHRRPLLATAIFTVGTMMKLQNIIYIPIYFIFIWRYFDLRTMVKSIATAATTFFALCFPFIWEHQMKQVYYLLTVNSDYFPWLSLNAHNLWWIVAGGHGMQVMDKITVLGILNAKTVGLLLFAVCYLLFIILIYLKPSPRNFLLALTMVIYAFFLFTTQSHERYSYPVIVLLLLLYPFIKDTLDIRTDDAGRTGKLEYFWVIYALLSLSIFINIYSGFILNYPQNGFYILSNLSAIPLGIFNSYLLIFLFFLLLPWVFSQISLIYTLIPPIFFLSGLLVLNFSYLAGKPISLTKFKPIIVKQDFGVLQTNKSVNSFDGWKSWSRLSDDYFFYRNGFGTHANSNLVFDVGGKFKSFSTDFGVDTEAATPASVMFKINGDGKLLYTSKKMGRFDLPSHTQINIESIKLLGLEVTDAGDGINSDHADWLNPVLYK